MTDYRLHTILLHTHNQLGNRSTADDFIGDFNVITEKKKKYVSWIILKFFDFFTYSTPLKFGNWGRADRLTITASFLNDVSHLTRKTCLGRDSNSVIMRW